jgi:uncharacterized protein YbjT (DUF2867 family)
MMSDRLPIRGTGPRLVSLADGAEILSVSEDAVTEWIAAGLLSCVTLASGEQRLELADEKHSGDATYQVSSTQLVLGRSASDHPSAADLRLELARKLRERELARLDPGLIDVDALASALAERLAHRAFSRAGHTGHLGVPTAGGFRSASEVPLGGSPYATVSELDE